MKAARTSIERHSGHVIVLFADTPLFRPETLAAVTRSLAGGTHVAVVGFEAADPTNYGRLVRGPDGKLEAIREHKDASAAERQIKLWLTPESEAELIRSQCIPEKLYPPDIARMVLWLAADDSRLVTNHEFVVDGGVHG